MIELRHVTKIYPGDVVALDDVDISIGKGEFVFVLGHSGAGKSTLLKLLLREINKLGTTVVVVTHDVELASHFNARRITLEHGRVIEDRKGAEEE